jgi:Xaa-Pro aminopeptidase
MEKIKKLKKLFNNLNIDGYLIPKNDEFFSEYINKNNDYLRYISEFSGSYGFALVLKKKNYLFVDGRYTLQAKMQSAKKFKVLTVPEVLPFDILRKKNLKIGFDPKLHTEKNLHQLFRKTKAKLIPIQNNLINKIWNPKNDHIKNEFFILKNSVSGESFLNKIKKVSNILNKKKIDLHFITAPENVAWLLNIRGGDCNFSPIPKAYALLDKKKNINLFCDLKKINRIFKKQLKHVRIIDIKLVEPFLRRINNKKMLLDSSTCSIFFKDILKRSNIIIQEIDPIYYLKSIKNKIEIKHTLKSHIIDGAALTKFLFWIKDNFKKGKITEIDAQNKLLKFRKRSKNFISLSFPTISGSGPNGSIIHYKANKKTNRLLKTGDIYLVDSGGQYKFGTTDVTRTISLDNKNNRIRNIFTRVLKGHIAVSNYKINKNTSGSQIDFIARKPLNEIKLDYAHGTGHGVGYFLNVHEGPQGISKFNKVKLKKGMILSNEPGYYENRKFGIRIENLILIEEKNKNLYFTNLTMAPIDKSLIEKNLLNKKEIVWLNNYHSSIFKNLKNFMNRPEKIKLKEACSNI